MHPDKKESPWLQVAGDGGEDFGLEVRRGPTLPNRSPTSHMEDPCSSVSSSTK